nr:unnamed protein product [Spirometra erinaceieuropaei]
MMRILGYNLPTRASAPLSALACIFGRSKTSPDMAAPDPKFVEKLKNKIENAAVLVFAKSTCPYCIKVKKRFTDLKIPFGYLDLDHKATGPITQSALKVITGVQTVPQIFFRGKFMGGCSDVEKIPDDELVAMSQKMEYDYDLLVIGGGSGGLALAKLSTGHIFSSRYIVTDEEERTNIPNIYAVGDINSRGLKLTPVAIQAGKNLARRLYAADDVLTEYDNVPTTVFTPLEYGSIGLSEENAIEKYTAEKIQVYHSHFQPLEWTVPHRDDNVCYAKLICLKTPVRFIPSI